MIQWNNLLIQAIPWIKCAHIANPHLDIKNYDISPRKFLIFEDVYVIQRFNEVVNITKSYRMTSSINTNIW
jgi:hypothetical protein